VEAQKDGIVAVFAPDLNPLLDSTDSYVTPLVDAARRMDSNRFRIRVLNISAIAKDSAQRDHEETDRAQQNEFGDLPQLAHPKLLRWVVNLSLNQHPTTINSPATKITPKMALLC
jgi:hypothetical protein